MTNTTSSVDRLAHRFRNAMTGQRFPLTDEKRLQEAIDSCLTEAGIHARREVELGDAGKVDFMLRGGVAVECKLRAPKMQIYRQLRRYAEHADVKAIVLVTNTAMGLPPEISGKPAYYFALGSAWL